MFNLIKEIPLDRYREEDKTYTNIVKKEFNILEVLDRDIEKFVNDLLVTFPENKIKRALGKYIKLYYTEYQWSKLGLEVLLMNSFSETVKTQVLSIISKVRNRLGAFVQGLVKYDLNVDTLHPLKKHVEKTYYVLYIMGETSNCIEIETSNVSMDISSPSDSFKLALAELQMNLSGIN